MNNLIRPALLVAIVLAVPASASATAGGPPEGDPRDLSIGEYTRLLNANLADRFGPEYSRSRDPYALCPETTGGYDGETDTWTQVCEFVFGTGTKRSVGTATITTDPEGRQAIRITRQTLRLRSQTCTRLSGLGVPPRWRLTYIRVRTFPGTCKSPQQMAGDVLFDGRGGSRGSLPNSATVATGGTGTGAHPSIYRYTCKRSGKTMRCENRIGWRFSFRAVRR